MDKLESEKRNLQIKLDQPISEPPSPREANNKNGDTAATLANNIHQLRQEVAKLKQQLTVVLLISSVTFRSCFILW